MKITDRAILATRRQGIPEEVRKCMNKIRSAATPEARAHATIELASAIPTGEIRAWPESGWFDLRGGMELTLFNKILIDRWLAEDPQAVIAWGLKTGRKDTPACWRTGAPGTRWPCRPTSGIIRISACSMDRQPAGRKGQILRRQNLATTWIQHDPDGLESWLTSQPESAGKEIRGRLKKAGKR